VARKAEQRGFPTQAEIELWRAVLRDVRPLRGRKPAPPLPPPAAAPATPSAPPRAVPTPGPEGFAAEGATPLPHGLDKRTAERLRRGQMVIEARIDLHGMRQDEAHRALLSLIDRADRGRLRCLLVITGKGIRRAEDHDFRPEAIGVLKHAVPRWLAEPALRPRILAVAPAQPRHGGSGALYVLLRRQRSAR
jgi:DNA-nicking Smr family endonuclease